jgi:NAD(P)-dependent dehydrogenase (short-subunit alcohol dehydrogenase family)
MIDVNIKGVLYRIAAALPYMKQQQAGHFINVSVAGHTDSASAQRIRKFYQEIAIPAESFARAVAFRREPAGGRRRERDPVPAHAPGAVNASWLGLTAELT